MKRRVARRRFSSPRWGMNIPWYSTRGTPAGSPTFDLSALRSRLKLRPSVRGKFLITVGSGTPYRRDSSAAIEPLTVTTRSARPMSARSSTRKRARAAGPSRPISVNSS